MTQESERHFANGNLYSNRKLWVEAIEEYNLTIKIDPKYVSVYWERAYAYCMIEKLDKAIDDYTQIIKLRSFDASAYSHRGRLYMHKGKSDKAIADYTRAIELEPNESSFYYHRGFTYVYKTNKYDKAIADFTRAIELNPKFVEAYQCRSLAYESIDELGKSKDDLRKACQLENEMPCPPGHVQTIFYVPD